MAKLWELKSECYLNYAYSIPVYEISLYISFKERSERINLD